MLSRIHHPRLLAAIATAALIGTTAPSALARPIDTAGPTPERAHVVRVQVDDGLDWADTAIGAAGMLGLVLIGFGAARAVQPRGAGALSR